MVYRRHHQACPRHQRLHQPLDQFLTSVWSRASRHRCCWPIPSRNRSASCRYPVDDLSEGQARRSPLPPDPTANPYLGFAALLMAGLRRHPEQDRSRPGDGQGSLRSAATRAEERFRPSPPRCAKRSRRSTRTAPSSKAGGVFNDDMIDALHRPEDGRRHPFRPDPASGRVRHVLLRLIDVIVMKKKKPGCLTASRFFHVRSRALRPALRGGPEANTAPAYKPALQFTPPRHARSRALPSALSLRQGR